MTNSNRSHTIATVLGGLVVGVGALALLVGLWSWGQDRPAPVRVAQGESVQVPPMAWFEDGWALFGTVDRLEEKPSARAVRCSVSGTARSFDVVRSLSDADVGTRVSETGAPLQPIAEVGPTAAGDRLTCRALGRREAWLMATDPAPDRTPLTLVIAGVVALALGCLVLPQLGGRRHRLLG